MVQVWQALKSPKLVPRIQLSWDKAEICSCDQASSWGKQHYHEGVMKGNKVKNRQTTEKVFKTHLNKHDSNIQPFCQLCFLF